MLRDREIEPGQFHTLLKWLNQDPLQAAFKYEQIRARLIQIFILRGCRDAEELADETIDRVTLKAGELIKNYDESDPALYFYGVARLVHLEAMRSPQRKQVPLEAAQTLFAPISNPVREEEDCLERCLQTLPLDAKRLLLEYFEEEKQAKINRRKTLAESLGITTNILRVRILRLKKALQPCLEKCLEGNLK